MNTAEQDVYLYTQIQKPYRKTRMNTVETLDTVQNRYRKRIKREQMNTAEQQMYIYILIYRNFIERHR